MLVYVSYPYSSEGGETPPDTGTSAALAQARETLQELIRKGHSPLTPLLPGSAVGPVFLPDIKRVVFQEWIRHSDAFFYLSDSSDAKADYAFAKSLNLPIFRHIDDIPANSSAVEQSSPQSNELPFHGYSTEYEQCMDSYRHTYATIWQAGTVFIAVSAGILAFGKPDKAGEISLGILLIAPLPILFWYQGIFRPMNRYGEGRRKRLQEIEALLNGLEPRLQMRHVTDFNKSPKYN
jgi:hypothetical protein